MEKMKRTLDLGERYRRIKNDSEVSTGSLGFNQCRTCISSHKDEKNHRKKRVEDCEKELGELLHLWYRE